MPYEFYKVLHILFVLAAVTAVVGNAVLAGASGGEPDPKRRKVFGIVHGVSMLVIFVAGFGLMARIGVGMGAGTGWPTWIFLKLGLWLFFAGLLAVPRRKPQHAWKIVVLAPLVAATAAAVAVIKPFA